jgi:outer membrane protein OmpA-like peptidoglycan-associated protein
MALDATHNKKTGPAGDVDQQSSTQAHLSDFDIDGAEVGVDGARLKPKHIAFLNSLIDIIKGAPGQPFSIVIGGHTDTLNTSGGFDNKKLSDRRAAAVESFLRSRLPPGAIVTFDTEGFGPVRESLPNTPDSFARAVDVALTAPGDRKPERPRGPSPGGPAGPRSFPRALGRGGFVFGCLREFEVPRSQNFKIRITDLEITSLTIGVKRASITFQIVDTDGGLGAEYGFSGADLVLLGPIEETFIRDRTKFVSFTTPAATRITDFQSATLKTGLAASQNLLGPLPKPTITLVFNDENGTPREVQSPIDMSGKEGTLSRLIKGKLSMNSTCRGSRGALQIDRTNDFL